MWWQRPWRWILDVVAAAVLLGLLNMVVKAAGEPAFLGVGRAGRLVAFVAISLALEFIVVPSPEKMDRGAPLPPLPSHDEAGHVRRGWQGGDQSRQHKTPNHGNHANLSK